MAYTVIKLGLEEKKVTTLDDLQPLLLTSGWPSCRRQNTGTPPRQGSATAHRPQGMMDT